MPTVLLEGGFRLMIYFEDHEPPHVHAIYGNAVAIFNLEDIELRNIKGKLSFSDIKKARDLVERHQEFLIQKWNSIVKGD